MKQWGELTNNKWVLSIFQHGFLDTIQSYSPSFISSDKTESIFFPLLQEEIVELLQKRAVERVQDPGTLGFYSRLFLVPKKNGKLRPVIDFSLLNQCIMKQAFKMEMVKSVCQAN